MKDKGSEKEQITHATIGSGNITVGGETNSDLEGLNRDVERAQEITKDKITGALDGSMTIDNRVFSGEGWRSIIEDHTNLVGNTLTVLGDIWNLPNTMIGATIGAIGVLLGARHEYDEENRIHNIIGNPLFHMLNGLFGEENLNDWATTFGQVVNYFGYVDDYGDGIDIANRTYEYSERVKEARELGLFVEVPTEDDWTIWREHENRHVQQYRQWGPLFLPMYLLDNPFTSKNRFEADADKYGNQKYKGI
ncbi:MAG: hypothetical protein ACI4N3_01560 [Alphaproteobacteria bacterium]